MKQLSLALSAGALVGSGINLFNALNHQNVLDEHKTDIDFLSSSLTSLTSRVTKLESSSSKNHFRNKLNKDACKRLSKNWILPIQIFDVFMRRILIL